MNLSCFCAPCKLWQVCAVGRCPRIGPKRSLTLHSGFQALLGKEISGDRLPLITTLRGTSCRLFPLHHFNKGGQGFFRGRNRACDLFGQKKQTAQPEKREKSRTKPTSIRSSLDDVNNWVSTGSRPFQFRSMMIFYSNFFFLHSLDSANPPRPHKIHNYERSKYI